LYYFTRPSVAGIYTFIGRKIIELNTGKNLEESCLALFEVLSRNLPG
jgi:hypothetical protein